MSGRSPRELIKHINEDKYEKDAAGRAAQEAVNDCVLNQSGSHHNVTSGEN